MNYLHLDFKGICPAYKDMFKWLKFFSECGFKGIVLEWDCRLDWRTFPNAAIPRFSHTEAAEIIEYCESLGMEAIPLVQIQGHLEWVLKHEKYARFREHNHYELCPSFPESIPLLEQWIEEVLKLFPKARHIHLGADEVWNLASCPRCRARAEADHKRGKLGIYLDHVSALSRFVIGKNIRPIIWGDMFLRAKRPELASGLPSEVILNDWQYTGSGPWQTKNKLAETGHDVWGASAVQCAWYEHFWNVINVFEHRLENVTGWQKMQCPVIHTTWGRPGNMWNLYPAWFASYPVFIAAGNSAKWQKHHLRKLVEKASAILRRKWPHELTEFIAEIASITGKNNFEQNFLRYLLLGMRYELIFKNYEEYFFGKQVILETEKFVGHHPDNFRKHYVDSLPALQIKLAEWSKDMTTFFRDNHLSDVEEFISEKTAFLRSKDS